MGAQRDDEDHKLRMIEKGKIKLEEHVKSLLVAADTDNNGSLSDEEIKAALADSELKLMERLATYGINMEMEDLIGLLTRLKEAVGTEDIPLENATEALRHLSGDASAKSIWDVKMLLLQCQSEQTSGVHSKAEALKLKVGSHKECTSGGNSEVQAKVDMAMAQLKKVEERFQFEYGRLDSNISKLTGQIERLDRFQSDSARAGDNVLDRLFKIEKAMQVLCQRIVNGGAACEGSGEGGLFSELELAAIPVD